MSGLAYLLKRSGFYVDGCDKTWGAQCEWLADHGVPVVNGHSPSHASKEYDLVVITPAVDRDDTEVKSFRNAGSRIAVRGQVLPLLLKGKLSVAVAGTHGKTTTSSFVARVLQECGVATGWCIGGTGGVDGGVAYQPDGIEAMVVEADESDGTLAGYSPDISVITNIDFDHMEHFRSFDDLKACFGSFASGTRRRLVYCSDDNNAAEVCRSKKGSIGYGFGENAQLRVAGLKLNSDSSEFRLSGCGLTSVGLRINCPGIHNVLNAVAAVAVGLEFGADIYAIKEILTGFRLPDRRFQQFCHSSRIVVSDYAHHPAEIKALIDAARLDPADTRLRGVFQPHRYTRTRALGTEFPASFEGLDELIILPVYAASEKPSKEGSSFSLYRKIREAGTVKRLLYARSIEAACKYYLKSLAGGERLLVIGAGDVELIAKRLMHDFEESADKTCTSTLEEFAAEFGNDRVTLDYPLGKRSMFGSGGTADAFAEADSIDMLGGMLAYCSRSGLKLNIFGSGGNIIVSDLGVRGVTVHLDGSEFNRIDVNGTTVTAGAGVQIMKLLEKLEEFGLSGLEFLEGVPGTIGGAVRMNAGAFGGQIGDYIESITVIGTDGNVSVLKGPQIVYSYRAMNCLGGRIVAGVDFRMKKVNPAEIVLRRLDLRQRRAWLRGKRTAGSVFRNPTGLFAGKLIEDAGLKGLKIGGVSVSQEHGNVFENDGNGTSSDMISMMDLVAMEVLEKYEVVLEKEVVVLE